MAMFHGYVNHYQRVNRPHAMPMIRFELEAPQEAPQALSPFVLRHAESAPWEDVTWMFA